VTTAALQKNILGFYANPSAPIETRKDPGKWQKVQTNLDALKTFAPNPALPKTSPATPAAASPTGGMQ